MDVDVEEDGLAVLMAVMMLDRIVDGVGDAEIASLLDAGGSRRRWWGCRRRSECAGGCRRA